MKALALLLALTTVTAPAFAQTTLADRNASLKQEVQLSYKRGLGYLGKLQNAETGAWGEAEPVALTAIVLAGFMSDPDRKFSDPLTPAQEKGYAFLLKNAQPDGGIYVKARANYNTSLALMALVMSPKADDYQQIILKARRYLIGRQVDLDEKGKTDNPLDGGIGYGDEKGFHADLSNTHFALEALKYADVYLADKGDALKNEPKLNFAAAIEFIQRCQNRPESNKQPWVSTDAKDYGGFIYGPTETRGPKVDQNGRTAMRSYGSISYAGLMSFIYAGLDETDPRVQAAITWLSENFTLDENPGLGPEGQFYYYHTMAKSLTAAKLDELKLKNGKKIDWRDELTHKLLNTQQGDGNWVNAKAGRWMETDPILVTGYVLMSLGHIYHGL